MVGICSYLLVNFWFTRSYANQSSISAFLTNRVGDCLLTVGMFTVAWSMGDAFNIKFTITANKKYQVAQEFSYSTSIRKNCSWAFLAGGLGLPGRGSGHLQSRPYTRARVTGNLSLSTTKKLDAEMEKFYEWFVGFTDGEGSFLLNKQGKNNYIFIFKINLHIDDISVLQFIRDTLGFGKVVMEISRPVGTFIVTKLEDIQLILNIFYSYPLNSTKLLNFLKFSEAYKIYTSSDNKANIGNRLEAIKSVMNNKRTDFKLPVGHKYRITPYWLLGFIVPPPSQGGGEGGTCGAPQGTPRWKVKVHSALRILRQCR